MALPNLTCFVIDTWNVKLTILLPLDAFENVNPTILDKYFRIFVEIKIPCLFLRQ